MKRAVAFIAILGLIFIATDIARASFDDGLILHYEFEGNADDSSGNDYHGTAFGGLNYVQGVRGQAASFDGIDDYIDTNTRIDNLTSMSVFAWVKYPPQNYTGNIMIVTNIEANSGGFSLHISNGYPRATLRPPSDLSVHAAYPPAGQIGVWVLWGFTWDGNVLRLYVDGIEVASNIFNDTIDISTYNVRLGIAFGDPSRKLVGEVDDLRIYDRALNPAEIQALYDGLILHYEFEGNADDSSGNDYHGTEFGGLNYVQGVIGQAASFDGIDDYIDVGTALGNYTGLSVFAWVNVDSIGPYQSIIQANWYRGLVLKNDGGFVFRTNNNAPWSFKSWILDNFDIGITVNHLEPIQTGIWTAVGYTWDGQTMKTYVNGIETNSDLYNGIMGISSKTTLVGGGRDDAGNPLDELFPGDIDDLKVYNRALTHQEILSLYATVSSTSPSHSATDVAVDSAITATFPEAMDAATINTNTFFLDNGVTGTVSYDAPSTTMTFTPASNLDYDTTYTATITTGVEDLSGDPLRTDYVWSFTTQSNTDGGGGGGGGGGG